MIVLQENNIAMVSALTRDNVYFIFRNTREQVEIVVSADRVEGTHQLTADEMKHISLNYPWIDILKYRVIPKKFE